MGVIDPGVFGLGQLHFAEKEIDQGGIGGDSRWNWRQGRRTQLTLDTHNAYFVLDRLPPYSIEALMTASNELMKLLASSSPGCTLTYELLGGK